MKWIGSDPTKCDLCGLPLGDCMIDGRTTLGPWAIMCNLCHSFYGYGLGIGKGQMYTRLEDGWHKVENVEKFDEFGQRI